MPGAFGAVVMAAMLGIALPARAQLPATPPVERSAVIAKGLALARAHCAACHQVAPGQALPPAFRDPVTGGAVIPPSFMALANDPARDAAQLRGVLARPHFGIQPQRLAAPDRDAIVAYLLALRPPPAPAPPTPPATPAL